MSGQVDPNDRFHAARRHSEIAIRRLRTIPEGGGRADLPDNPVFDCHRDHKGHYDIYGRMWWDQVAPTQTSWCTNVTRGRFAHPVQDRAITLREAMLLQTFPPTAELRGGVEAMALQVGNAAPGLLAQRIGEQIAAMEEVSRSGGAPVGLAVADAKIESSAYAFLVALHSLCSPFRCHSVGSVGVERVASYCVAISSRLWRARVAG